MDQDRDCFQHSVRRLCVEQASSWTVGHGSLSHDRLTQSMQELGISDFVSDLTRATVQDIRFVFAGTSIEKDSEGRHSHWRVVAHFWLLGRLKSNLKVLEDACK